MPKRPSVQLTTPNDVAALRHHLMTLLPQLQALPGVIGITLNGGLSRGYGDHLSEIDATLYLTNAAYMTWQQGQSPISTGITILNSPQSKSANDTLVEGVNAQSKWGKGGQLYDINVVDYQAEVTESWSSDACWDASYAEILYDPDGLIAQLYAEKLANPPAPKEAQALLMSCWWYYRLAGDIWLYRGDALQGHHMMHQAVITLVKALFVANREWIPHEKWLIHMSRTLAWQPADWANRLQQAFGSGDGDLAMVEKRQQVIDTLWSEVDYYLIATYSPHLPVHFMQRSFYELLAQLSFDGTMSRATWEQAGGGTLYNVDPFHKVVTVVDDQIHLNRQRLLALGPTTMYEWHFAVVEALRHQLT